MKWLDNGMLIELSKKPVLGQEMKKKKKKKEKNDPIVQVPVHLFIRRSWRRTLEWTFTVRHTRDMSFFLKENLPTNQPTYVGHE